MAPAIVATVSYFFPLVARLPAKPPTKAPPTVANSRLFMSVELSLSREFDRRRRDFDRPCRWERGGDHDEPLRWGAGRTPPPP